DGGANWTTLWTNGGSTISENSWSQQNIALPATFNGKSNVLIRWGMGPTGTNNSTYPGWNIDDVLVTGSPLIQPSISGKIYVDANTNSALDAGEAGIPGVTVFLDSNGNGLLDPAVTANYASSNVPVSIPDN